MFDEILDTKTKIRIAKLLSEHREPMTVSDVAKKLSISKSRASVCLRELNGKGFLSRKPVGRSILYSIASSRLAQSLAKPFSHDKKLVLQLERDVTEKLKGFSPVSIALFGSSLKGLTSGSDVDILLITRSDRDDSEIYKIVSHMTQEYGIHVSITAISLREFASKARRGEEFVLNIIATHKLLFGKKLEGLVWQEK